MTGDPTPEPVGSPMSPETLQEIRRRVESVDSAAPARPMAELAAALLAEVERLRSPVGSSAPREPSEEAVTAAAYEGDHNTPFGGYCEDNEFYRRVLRAAYAVDARAPREPSEEAHDAAWEEWKRWAPNGLRDDDMLDAILQAAYDVDAVDARAPREPDVACTLGVMGGQPCIAGTRIPVAFLPEDADEIVRMYPYVRHESAMRVVEWMRKFPHIIAAEQREEAEALNALRGNAQNQPIRITVRRDDSIPAFGAFVADSVSRGEGVVLFNVVAWLETVAAEADLTHRELMVETLTHEFAHAMEELYGLEFSEDRVERIANTYTGIRGDAAPESAVREAAAAAYEYLVNPSQRADKAYWTVTEKLREVLAGVGQKGEEA